MDLDEFYAQLPGWVLPVVAVVALALVAALRALQPTKSKGEPPEPKPERARPVGPFTAADVAKHNKADDAWLIIDGKVYDVTDFVEDHPGGDSILNEVGKDSSAGFHGDQHPETVAEAVEEYYIGELKKDQ